MTITNFTKRFAIAATLLAGTALSAAAEDHTITVWAGGTGDSANYRVDNIEAAAKILEQEAAIRGDDMTITVEKQVWSGWDDFRQAVTLAGEAGNGPNIIVAGHDDIAPWAQAGLLRPIEDYVYLDSWPLSQIYANLWDVATVNGQVWAVPQDAEARVMFWNIAGLKAIGWSDDDIAALPEKVKSGEVTMYDLVDAVKKMQDAGVVDAGNGFAPRPSNGLDQWQFYQSFGGEIADEATGKLVLDTAAMTKTFQFITDAVKDGVMPSTYLGLPWDTWHASVAAGKYGAWMGGSWHYAQWTQTNGMTDFFDKVQATLIPAGDKDGRANSITHPLVYMLSSLGSEDDAEISAQLIEIASNPELNALHAVKSGHLAIGEDEVKVPFYANDRWLAEASAFLPDVNSVPNNVNVGLYQNDYFADLQSVWTGSLTPEQAVDELKTKVQADFGDGITIR
ncbi:extracellular solute-binding protein [Martelella alba]|uniref:Extracellular solute-binding protein n=1 Tax=Martelella alba TaxID=2590451 RepID=A0A506UFW0_9HYPH|nr:extracellular solute-binding protein [Martelella alba]TPW32221.1 extracellular solute-binding protein [Martelella alba]